MLMNHAKFNESNTSLYGFKALKLKIRFLFDSLNVYPYKFIMPRIL